MELAVLSESSADEAGLFAFVQSHVKGPLARAACPMRVRRGWPAIRDDLGPALRAIYHYTSAQCLLIVVDADGAPLDENHPNDRLTQLNEIVGRSLRINRQDRPPLRVAIGLAVPSIEAWWRAPHDPLITEAAWKARQRPGGAGYTKLSLKSQLYGTEDPSLASETAVLCNGAAAVAAAASVLAARFPYGFLPMLREIQSWDSPL